MYPVNPPIEGMWEYGDNYPDMIEIEGEVFHRAIRAQPYEGVVEQYRASSARNSAHLLVRNNGTWVIDHVDEYNPDMGHPLRHFIVDHPKGKGTLVAGAGLLGLAGSALFGTAKKEKANGNEP